MSRPPRYVLPSIMLAQALCTSLWFGGNVALPGLAHAHNLPAGAAGVFALAVQSGFIAGTLLFSLLAIADRFPATRVFFCCALAAAFVNALLPFAPGYSTLLVLRFGTGFLLAGIYPVGMKIASEHFPQGLGKALGYLVGALVLGTALPHGLRALGLSVDSDRLLFALSGCSVLGGILVLLLPSPAPRNPALPVRFRAALAAFRQPGLRRAAIGYFGHMWELYAFWTFLPLYLGLYAARKGAIPVSAAAFCIIAIGALACALAGSLSARFGAARIARIALGTSLACCMASPFLLQLTPLLFYGSLLLWGASVVADSPMFSALVAGAAPASIRGSVLTLVTCIGFAITLGSIGLLNELQQSVSPRVLLLLLAPGPLLGLLGFRRAS